MQRLRAVILAKLAARFAWGAADCCMLVADGVLALTGRDPAHDLRGTYQSRVGAARVVRALGGWRTLLGDRVGPRLDVGQPPWPGDVALLGPDGRGVAGVALGLVFGGTVIAQGAHGLVTVPQSAIVDMWRPR